jgi:hypothetical protein
VIRIEELVSIEAALVENYYKGYPQAGPKSDLLAYGSDKCKLSEPISGASSSSQTLYSQ